MKAVTCVVPAKLMKARSSLTIAQNCTMERSEVNFLNAHSDRVMSGGRNAPSQPTNAATKGCFVSATLALTKSVQYFHVNGVLLQDITNSPGNCQSSLQKPNPCRQLYLCMTKKLINELRH